MSAAILRTFGKMGLSALAGGMLLMPLAVRAENCQWLNAATAGGLLGGEAAMKVTHTSPEDTTCEFTLKHGAETATLKIEVRTMASVDKDFPAYRARCGTDSTPMRAIGNEAFDCLADDGPGRVREQIVSRVRERAFVLTWTFPKAGPNQAQEPGSGGVAAGGAPPPDTARDRFRNVAEQVAGSLF
jgi:hypothetical protein